jgi:tetratricopeptide (TPR) repeat protein
MSKSTNGTQFASLFKRYRLRSEIETLAEFGDLLTKEGIFYEDSLFTKWQKGERTPKDRKILFSILKIFIRKGGIHTVDEANAFFESTGLGYLTEDEQKNFPELLESSLFFVPRQIPQFIDRNDLSVVITRHLLQGQVTLISGPPGIGKTALAINIAHNLKSAFPDGILWYQLSSSSPMDILLSIAYLYGKDVSNISDLSIRASIVRSLTNNKKILFIFDSLEDESNFEHLLPSSPRCSTLITSIHSFISTESVEVKIHLKPFNANETIALFEMINGKQYTTDNSQKINQLFNAVEGHPLALQVISKQILYSKKPIDIFINSFKGGHSDLKGFSYHNKNLDITLSTVFNKLTEIEQKILVSTSVFPGKDFSVAAISFINHIPYDEATNILEQLVNYSLIEHSVKNKFRIHPLIRLFLSHKLIASMTIKAALFYIHVLKQNKSKQNYYIFINNEFENIKHIFEYCLKQKKWEIICSYWEYLADYLWHTRHWKELEQYGERIYNARDLHKNTKATISSLTKLSNLYYWKRDISLAEKYTKEGLKFANKTNDNKFLYNSKQFLGRILIGKNDANSAEKLLFESKIFFEKQNDNEKLGDCYKYLGEISFRRNNLIEALQCFEKSNTYYNLTNITASKLVNQAIIFIYIGGIYLLQNKIQLAEQLFNQGLDLCKKSNETWGIQTFGYLGLGLAFEKLKDNKKMSQCFEKVEKGIRISGFKNYLLYQNSYFYGLKDLVKKSVLFRQLFY